jgi:hypothetical protein
MGEKVALFRSLTKLILDLFPLFLQEIRQERYENTPDNACAKMQSIELTHNRLGYPIGVS